MIIYGEMTSRNLNLDISPPVLLSNRMQTRIDRIGSEEALVKRNKFSDIGSSQRIVSVSKNKFKRFCSSIFGKSKT